MAETVIEARGIEVAYGAGRHRKPIIHGASFEVGPGESVGVIGETGSGKSTIARALVGLVPVAEGAIRIGGEDVTSFRARQWREFRRRGVIQYVFQDPLRALDPDLTVGESLAEPLRLQGRLSK